jgi:hypothetical protein
VKSVKFLLICHKMAKAVRNNLAQKIKKSQGMVSAPNVKIIMLQIKLKRTVFNQTAQEGKGFSQMANVLIASHLRCNQKTRLNVLYQPVPLQIQRLKITVIVRNVKNTRWFFQIQEVDA